MTQAMSVLVVLLIGLRMPLVFAGDIVLIEPLPNLVPKWSSAEVYHKGEQVSFLNKAYQATQWTHGDLPQALGLWGPWRLLPQANLKPERQIVSTSDIGAGLADSLDIAESVALANRDNNLIEVDTKASYPQWEVGLIYLAGSCVRYRGVMYQALWWTRGDNPEEVDAWGVWRKVDEAQ